VIGQHELRHGLKHRYFDELPLRGLRAMIERSGHRIGDIKTDRSVADIDRGVARRAVDGPEQTRHARRGLHQVVIDGLA
jgi:hypothetical protein